jgi:hypothetical protein
MPALREELLSFAAQLHDFEHRADQPEGGPALRLSRACVGPLQPRRAAATRGPNGRSRAEALGYRSRITCAQLRGPPGAGSNASEPKHLRQEPERGALGFATHLSA